MEKDILVVDDDPDIRITLKGVLEDEGYNVVAVEDGLKAIEALRTRPFSLVLMDAVMPRLGGLETMKELDKIRPTTVIIMTGHVDEEKLLQEGKHRGARAILHKPLHIPELLRLVKDILVRENPRLLVVDDEDTICKILSEILMEAGYWVEVAQDGQRAIEMARQSDYHLVFMDAKLPGINGFHAMKEIKKIKPYIPVVMFTGYKIESFMERSKECGARAIMYKPFNEEDVLELTAEILTERK